MQTGVDYKKTPAFVASKLATNLETLILMSGESANMCMIISYFLIL